jgi:hypothetical protein
MVTAEAAVLPRTGGADFSFAPARRVGDSDKRHRRRGGMADTSDLKSEGM